MLFSMGCAQQTPSENATALRFADREAIEDALSRANLGFELNDPNLFAGAFAEDAVFQLDGKGPVFGFDKMTYQGRADIRRIITDSLEKFSKIDPTTLSFDPGSFKMYNLNSDGRKSSSTMQRQHPTPPAGWL
jgi:hypothetical protein